MGRDLREYANKTNFFLVVGFILLLLVVGDGLIFLFYGRSAALTGLFCILAAFIPIGMILIAFRIIDAIIRANR